MNIITSTFEFLGRYLLYAFIFYFFFKVIAMLFYEINDDEKTCRIIGVLSSVFVCFILFSNVTNMIILIFLIFMVSLPFLVKMGQSAYHEDSDWLNYLLVIFFSGIAVIKVILLFITNSDTPSGNSNSWFSVIVEIISLIATFSAIRNFSKQVWKSQKEADYLGFIDQIFLIMWLMILYFYFPTFIPEISPLFSTIFVIGLTGTFYLKKHDHEETKNEKNFFVILFVIQSVLILLLVIHFLLRLNGN